jgi:hypothetical protein
LVKVMAAIFEGLSLRRWIRYAIFWVITLVLPEPAPASTSSGLSQCSTAASCCGLSMDRKTGRAVVDGNRALLAHLPASAIIGGTTVSRGAAWRSRKSSSATWP